MTEFLTYLFTATFLSSPSPVIFGSEWFSFCSVINGKRIKVSINQSPFGMRIPYELYGISWRQLQYEFRLCSGWGGHPMNNPVF